MTDDKVQVSYSFPFCSVLFILFLALKLTGHIDWSWWWVTAPLWGPWAAFFGLAAIALMLTGTAMTAISVFEWNQDRKWKNRRGRND